MSGQLERLLEQATPGPWTFDDNTDRRGRKGEFRAPSPHNGFMLVGPWTNDADARLIALCPDLGRLLMDAMAHLSCLETPETTWSWSMTEVRALLARFAALEEKA